MIPFLERGRERERKREREEGGRKGENEKGRKNLDYII